MTAKSKPLARPAPSHVQPAASPRIAAMPVRGLAAPPNTVQVRLVWPASRGAKDDCRAGTGIIWRGHGDVQNFPADKWSKLAPHPDVWELESPTDALVANQAFVDRVESPAAKVERINAADQAERDRLEADRIKVLAAQTNADAVALNPATNDGTALAVGAARADDAAEPDAVPMRAVAPRAVLGLSGKPAEFVHLDRAALEAMSDEDIHAEGRKREYALHPRLTPENLRETFLERQSQR